MTRQAERHARKHRTEASFENQERTKWKMKGCGAIKRAARRADRRLAKAICADALAAL